VNPASSTLVHKLAAPQHAQRIVAQFCNACALQIFSAKPRSPQRGNTPHKEIYEHEIIVKFSEQTPTEKIAA